MESVTVGICAYNEESNIESSIRSAFRQTQDRFSIEEVIVVSSGSTDGTDSIVSGLTDEYPRLKLYVEPERRGKNSAINLLLEKKKTDIVVLLNADNTLKDPDTLERLVSRLFEPSDPPVGIVGGHPVPTNDPNGIVGYAVHLLWSMHHCISLTYPKIGELVAFRDIGTRLPLNSQSDEDILRMKLEESGYVGAYAEDAIILNRGPETFRDFIKQRTRVNVGEVYMKKLYGYNIPTWNGKLLGNAILDSVKTLGPHPFRLTVAIMMEAVSRMRAKAHVRKDRGDMNVWDQVESTKKL